MSQTKLALHGWGRLTGIYLSGIICLPTLLIGFELCRQYGFFAALLSIFLGNMLLLALGWATSLMSARAPKSTVEHALGSFGKVGGNLFGILLVAVMLTWFAVQLNMMSLALFSGRPFAASLLYGGVMTLLSLRGIGALSLLSKLCLPIVLAATLWATFSSPLPAALPLALSWKQMGGVSLVMGAAIAAVIDLPTFFRHARTRRDGMISTLLLFGVALPLVEGVGAYLAASMPSGTIVDVFSSTWGVAFLLLAGWMTSQSNLFSATAGLQALQPKWPPWKRALVLGGVGTLFSLFDPLAHLENVINAIGIGIGSMGGVMLANYLRKTQGNLAAAAIGAACGFINLSGIALLDAYIAACGSALLLSWIKVKNYETN